MIATIKQQQYLQILFDDLGFDRMVRNDWLSLRLKRDIKFLDQLSMTDASICIHKLKELKEDREDKKIEDDFED